MKKQIFFLICILFFTVSASANAAQEDSAKPQDEIFSRFVYAQVEPEPVELADGQTLETLKIDWLESQKKAKLEALSTGREAAQTETRYSTTFWIVIVAVAVLIILPLIVSFGAAARKVNLTLKLYNSHGSLVLLALILGVSGYLYITRVTGVSDLDWKFLELNTMVNKVYVAQNNYLLYGTVDKEYGERQLADIKSIMGEFKEDFEVIKANPYLLEEEKASLDQMAKAASSYEKSFGVLVKAFGNIQELKKQTDRGMYDTTLDLSELARYFRSILDNSNLQGASYETRQFNTLMVKRLSEAEVMLRRIEMLKADFLADRGAGRIKEMADYLGKLKGLLNVIETGLQEEDEKILFESVSTGVDNYIGQLRKLAVDTASVNLALLKTADNIINVTKITSGMSEKLGIRADSISGEANTAATILIAMALLVGIIPTVLVTSSITKPLAKVVAMIEELGKGHLDERLNLDRSDEIGKMAKAMDNFADNLQCGMVGSLERLAEGDLTIETELKDERDAIMGALSKTVADLNRIIGEINLAGDQIAAGSAQVSDSSHSLSQATTEQASSIEQITSAIEEVSSQTKLNADNAAQANQLAQHTRESAEKGNHRMKDMLVAMEEINESGKNVSKIIKVIDEIAFQTNLLALNAAVEAARAGKHGKGFAVVAEEVRNLASRSAQAARETAELIEGSLTKAQNGADIADKTAHALEEIVTEVTKVTDLVGEIASASNDQARGIEEINRGLGEIDRIIQHNASIAEQGASSAEELSAQAGHLKEMLSRFKLSGERRLLVGEREEKGRSVAAQPKGGSWMEEGEPEAAASVSGRRASDIIALDDEF